MNATVAIIAADGHSFGAFAAGDPALPRALVLIDTLPGDTPLVRRLAARLAAFGYHILVPNLVERVEPNARLSYAPFEIARCVAIRHRLDLELALQDIAATRAAIAHDRVGVLGFGWGGTASWRAATRLDVFRAASCFYGDDIISAREATPNCPVQLVFAEGDLVITLRDVEQIRRAQPNAEIAVYPGSHDFACEERESFHPTSWEDARETMLAFFRRNL